VTRDTIGSKDPDALKIPARRAADYLTRGGSSPFPAEPRQNENLQLHPKHVLSRARNEIGD
jgi:hypothetical protein